MKIGIMASLEGSLICILSIILSHQEGNSGQWNRLENIPRTLKSCI